MHFFLKHPASAQRIFWSVGNLSNQTPLRGVFAKAIRVCVEYVRRPIWKSHIKRCTYIYINIYIYICIHTYICTLQIKFNYNKLSHVHIHFQSISYKMYDVSEYFLSIHLFLKLFRYHQRHNLWFDIGKQVTSGSIVTAGLLVQHRLAKGPLGREIVGGSSQLVSG